MLKVICYSSLCQLLKVLFFSWYIKGIPVLYVLVFALASHIYTLGYLLGPLFSKASLLGLLFLFLKVLLLCFLPLLNLFKALKLLPPIALTKLQLRLPLPTLAFISLTSIYFFNISLANIIL